MLRRHMNMYVNRYSVDVKQQPRASVSGTRVNDERPRPLQQDYKIIIIIQTPDSVLYYRITSDCCCSGS